MVAFFLPVLILMTEAAYLYIYIESTIT